MIEFLKQAWKLSRQAKENVDGAGAAEAAYEARRTLPDVLRAYSGQTKAKADDRADEAVLAAIGQAKQSAYNAAQILRGLAPLVEGLAAQADEVYAFLERAEKEPLKDLLED